MNALANALAHGGLTARLAGTVHAKTRHLTTPHNTAPQGKFFGVETSPSILTEGDAARANTASDETQRHGSHIGWMAKKP